MTKKLLSMLLAIAMVVSMFAGLATTASAAESMTLTFALNANPGSWPTANSTTTTNYTYTLDGVNYTFALNNVKCNAGYLMLTKPAALGLPVISGYKLTKVVANNSSGCSTSVKVGISSSDSSASYVTGGDAQTWATTGSSYTYNLTETAADTMYYLHVTNKNAQIVSLELTYAPADAEVHVHTYAWDGNVGVDGSHTLVCECSETTTEACADAEPVHTAGNCQNYGSTAYTCDVCGYTWTVADTEYGAHNYVDGICSLCGEAAVCYEPLTAAPAAWDGTYLIGHIADGAVWIFNGTDAVSDYVVATPAADGKITYTDGMAVVTIAAVEGGYTLQIGDKYMYSSGTSNGLTLGTTAKANALEFTADGVVITYGSTTFRFNATSDQNRFRYYKTTTTGTSYTYPTLYKLVEEVITDCQHTNATEVAAVPATCTAAGNSAYWSCPDCGKYFSDAAFTTETTLEAVTIPATGHTPGAYTCNEDGTHTYTCSVCSEPVTENCTAVEVETIPATCTSCSSTDYECSVCGGAWTVTGTEYGAHNWVNNACSVCSLTRNSYVKVADVTTLKDGDGIVIYYPTGAMLLSGTASDSKLAGVAGTVTDTTVAANNADELFLIVRVDANGDYYFETNDGKYLTSGETGNSLTLADSLTDYAKWYFDTTGTTATLRIVSRNAFYNGTTAQALEYYNGFTTYSLKDKAAYNFEVYQLEGFSAHTHTWDQGTVTTEATCTADGVKTFTCATCGDTMTEAIPATGHNYSAGDTCANCGLACIKGQLTAALADGDTVVVYNPAAGMTLTNTATGYHLAGLAAVDCGSYVLRAAPETVVWTVEVVDAAAGTYRFKTPDGVYFQSNSYGSFTNSATLPAAGEVDYSVWQLIDGKYLKNTGVSRALEYYGGKWQTYGSSSFGTAYELKFFKTNVESFCEHTYVETVISAPSCTTDGVSTFTCSLCGDTYTDTVVAPGHSYQVTAEVAATCTEAGSKTYTCSVCGDTYTEVVAATGHSDMNLDNLCDVCGVEVVNDAWALSTTAPAAGNKYVIVAHDATADKWYALTTADVNAATSAGKEVLVSNNVLYNPDEDVIFGGRDSSYTSNAVVHTGVGFYESNAGKCLHLNNSKIRVTTGSQNGVFTFTAGTTENTFTMLSTVNTRYLTFANGSFGVSDVSGTELYYFYKACDHDKTYISGAAEPTCTVAGSTGATKCSWCGTELVAAAEIPATGHSLELVAAVAATCTTDGNDAYYKCSVCGALFADAEGTTALNAIPTVPAAHNLEPVEAVAATCTADGNDAYYKCSVCGALFSDAEGTTALEAIPTITATGHTYTYTDNSDGTHTVGCANCDYSAVEDHSFTDGTCDLCGAVEVTEPTVDSTLVFAGHSLSLGDSLAINFTIANTTLASYARYSVTFEKDIYDNDGNVVDTEISEAALEYHNSTRMKAVFAGIAAREMSSEIRATIHAWNADGEEFIGPTDVYHIYDYCYTVLKQGSQYDGLKTVCADLLNYGAAAQVYKSYNTANLANKDLESSGLAAYASDPDSLTFDTCQSRVTEEGATISCGSNALELVSKTELYFSFDVPATADLSKVTVTISYTHPKTKEVITSEYTAEDIMLQSGIRYRVKFDKIVSQAMDSEITCLIYYDGVLQGTMIYSIASYVYNFRNNTTTALALCMRAMKLYGNAAKAYFNP